MRLQERSSLVNKVELLGHFPKVARTNEIVRLVNYFPYYSKNFYLYLAGLPPYEKNIARLHPHKNMNKPKKLDLGYRTVFPRERSWVRPQEISLRFAALIHG